MNDEEQHTEASGLSEAEEEHVRALLAEARHAEPMPDDVVARLDRVIAGLAVEDADGPAPLPDNVVPLAVRRRRAARMLVAAAAVVVAGVGVGQVLQDHGGGAGGDAATASDRGKELVQGESQGLSSGSDSSGGGSAGSGGGAVPSVPQAGSASDGVVAYKLRPEHFAADSRTIQRRYDTLDTTASLSAERFHASTCSPGSWGSGRYVPVEYGGTPAYLVLRRPSGDSQVADLFLCGGDEPVRSITLPGP